MKKFQELCDAVDKAIFQCALCHEALRQPRTLSCLHTFCDPCLRRHLANHRSLYRLVCPECQQITELSLTGIGGLPLNSFIVESQASLKQFKKTRVEVNREPVRCVGCKSCGQSHVAVCPVCAIKFEETLGASSANIHSNASNFPLNNQYIRLPVEKIKRIAYLCRLSYYTQECCIAVNNVNERRNFIFVGNSDFKPIMFRLLPCCSLAQGNDENDVPNILRTGWFFCKTCTKAVCQSCEYTHRYHDAVPQIASILRYIEHFNSSPHAVICSTQTIEFSSATVLDKELLHLYMQHDVHKLGPQSLDTGIERGPNAAHISVRAIEQAFLVCALCSKSYSEPTFFPCRHVFCKSCVSKYLSLCLSLGQSIREIPCPKCKRAVDCSNGVDQFPNGCFDGLMELFDKYNAEAESKGDVPSYDLPHRCGVCRASCSEVVIFCQVCVDEFRQKSNEVTEHCEMVTVRRAVYDRIMNHIECLCDASILLSLLATYHRCTTCNLFSTNLYQCNICHVEMCRPCIFKFHSTHASTTNRQALEEAAVNTHARALSTLCDNIIVVNRMITDMDQASRTVIETFHQQNALSKYMHAPLLNNDVPAFDRRLIVGIWHIRRRGRPSPFVTFWWNREGSDWCALRIIEWTHGLNQLIAVVIGHVHHLVESARFMLA